ncbi:MAG: NosD domain-containing protein [Candidatus Bathyarchaeia archaeon]|jgi:parallel beta-helix repeat protein
MREGKILRKPCALVFALLLASMAGLLSSFQTAKAITTIYIQADGGVLPITAPIQRNGNVYTLTGNIISDTDGIVIETNNTILDGAGHSIQGINTPSSNGIYLSGNHNVTIKNIDIKGFESGILLDAYSTYNNIIGNTVERNVYGVNCWAYADNNSIIGNNITGNSLAGVWIAGSSNDTVTENNIVANSLGINLQSSSNDSIHHNNFVDNPTQTSIYESPGTWDNDYPSAGNYWSDYVGSDNYSGPNQNQPGSDGIGDTPYNCTANDQDRYPLMQAWTNIAVESVSPSKTAVEQGQNVTITVSVQNQGWEGQTTNVTVFVNTTIVSTFKNVALAGRSQTTLKFTWQTTAFARGNYTITTRADPVQNEPDIRDNTLTYSRIAVTITGDINGDGTVNILDAIMLSNSFLATRGTQSWNPNADLNDDGIVNILDAIILANNFGRTSTK